MKRRTLDLILSTGGALLAVLLVILALVMNNRADFANGYVSRELKAQDVQFSTLDKMDEQETAFTKANTGCVLKWAGQFVTTGKQAECYANEVLGAHLTYLATRLKMPQIADLDGKSFRELGVEQSDLKAQIATAEQSGDTAGAANLEQRLDDVTTLRDKVYQGTMLRGALLTTYGFGELGRTANQVETVAWWAAGVLVLLALAGFLHALRTPRDKAFALPEVLDGKTKKKEMAAV
jgi:hypothetical protein